MVSAYKNEQVFVSFHYLKREVDNGTGGTNEVPFKLEEFDRIFAGLQGIQQLDLSNEEILDELRFRRLAKIQRLERLNEKTISGIYQVAYWGHAIENSQKGPISATSLNLRPFLFLIYLSDSGRIYIASQYLGLYGGYTTIKSCIMSKLSNKQNIVASSFNKGNIDILHAVPKTVEIKYSKKSQSITGKHSIGDAGAIVFRKQNKDDGFEEEVTKKLLSHVKKPRKEIRHAISALLKENVLMEIDDEEVVDCRVLVAFNGAPRFINLLDPNSFATRFPVETPMNKEGDNEGHPVYEPLRDTVLKLLSDEIISSKEDV